MPAKSKLSLGTPMTMSNSYAFKARQLTVPRTATVSCDECIRRKRWQTIVM